MLSIGLYYQDKCSAIIAFADDEKLQWTGLGLIGALHDFLGQVPERPLWGRRLEILTNARDLVRLFTPPIRLALPESKSVGRKAIPCGNDLQWLLARDLCRYERWKIAYAPVLPATQKLWQTCHLTDSGNCGNMHV